MIIFLILFGCGTKDYEELIELNGKSIDEIEKRYGTPKYTSSFNPYKDKINTGKHRQYVYRTYPYVEVKSDTTIKEYCYVFDNYRLNVWFHLQDNKWVVISNFKWNNNVIF